MFNIYLHPDLILFARPFDPNITIKNPTTIENGEMVVEVTVDRQKYHKNQAMPNMEELLKMMKEEPQYD